MPRGKAKPKQIEFEQVEGFFASRGAEAQEVYLAFLAKGIAERKRAAAVEKIKAGLAKARAAGKVPGKRGPEGVKEKEPQKAKAAAPAKKSHKAKGAKPNGRGNHDFDESDEKSQKSQEVAGG